LYHSFLT